MPPRNASGLSNRGSDMEFQWYPGHMTKAMRAMQEDIKLIDLVIEILDARIPNASRNPDIDKLAQNKARLILLNKADLSDPGRLPLWETYFTDAGFEVLSLDSRTKTDMKAVRRKIEAACKEKRERDARRGIKNRPVRALVAGIPNVGKSTFINSFAGRASAKTGNKPGVTKGKQWIRLSKDTELLDTPGVLWPKFEDQTVGLHLAMIGAIGDNVLELSELSLEIIRFLCTEYPASLAERYAVDVTKEPATVLEEIARSRNCIKKGNEIDYDKASRLLVDEFRNGVIGRVTLELPESSG